MATAKSEVEDKEAALTESGAESSKSKPDRREIKGGIPYVVAPGILKKALEQIIVAERPDKFSANYMDTVLKLKGGAARAVPPFLKKMKFINADGTPTELYSKFKTDGGRSQAAFDGLKNAFSEMFRRNEYIHKANENSVKDTIVEITGLQKNDNIVRLMYSSFDAIRVFITSESEPSIETRISTPDIPQEESARNSDRNPIGLSYHINIVLPETENISVFNAIFRSLKENLL